MNEGGDTNLEKGDRIAVVDNVRDEMSGRLREEELGMREGVLSIVDDGIFVSEVDTTFFLATSSSGYTIIPEVLRADI